MFSCTFIGHRDCSSEIKNPLIETIISLIENENVRTFYVGTHGYFDRLVYNVLCNLEKVYDISFFVVPAYHPQSKETYYNPDKTLFPDVLDHTPYKFAIYKRNLYMIDHSHFMICCIDHPYSNSCSFLRIALAKKLRVINIGKYTI